MPSEKTELEDLDAEVYGGGFIAFFQHGLLVLEDVSSQAGHDFWDAANESFHLDDDSLYVAVQADVDGPVRVDVYHGDVPEVASSGLVSKFAGVLNVPSMEVKAHDSDDVVCLRVQLTGKSRRVEVFVNDGDWVDRVLLVLREPIIAEHDCRGQDA